MTGYFSRQTFDQIQKSKPIGIELQLIALLASVVKVPSQRLGERLLDSFSSFRLDWNFGLSGRSNQSL